MQATATTAPVTVVGATPTGLATAAGLALLGQSVRLFDPDPAVVAELESGRCPDAALRSVFVQAVASGRLTFTAYAEDAFPSTGAFFWAIEEAALEVPAEPLCA